VGRKSFQVDPVRESLWRDRFEKQKSGGLTVRDFCRQNKLSEKSYYYWQRKLRLNEKQSGPRPTREVSDEERRRFVELWKASGLTQAEFCKLNGELTQAQLSEWKGRIFREQKRQQQIDETAEVAFAEISNVAREPGKNQQKNALAAAKIEPRPIVEIRINGAVISIFDSAESNTVQDIFSVLMRCEDDWTK